jgi:FkbM family methyltransferase
MSWLGRNTRTVLQRPLLALHYARWLALKYLGFRGRESRMATGVRWGGFASFGDYLSQKDAPGYAIREYVRVVLRSDSVLLDIGANLGSFSIYVCSCGLERPRVFAFEPVPETFNRLRANVGRYGFPVRTERLALGPAEADCVAMEMSPDSPATAAISGATPPAGMVSVAAPMTTLDHFLREQKISHVDLAKLDIEGFEVEVIRGGEQALRNGQIRAMTVEVCPANLRQFGHTAGELYDSLLAYGFTSFLLAPRFGGSLREVSREEFCTVELDDVLCIHQSSLDANKASHGPNGAQGRPHGVQSDD